jgi:serine/threonine-protein kinase
MSDETTAFPPGDRSSDPHREDARRMQRVLDSHYGHRFQVDRVIGRGGMSTVWLAADSGAGETGETGKTPARDVAVKVLKPELTDDAEFRARFRAEAEAAETVHSQHVVETYDYGEVPDVDGTGVTYCFIVMEYVQGESLADILARERTLPEVMALDLLTQAATGLQAIHDRGLVHRDIKPGNLMITADGLVKVTDFGIAKAASAVPLTRTGMVVGTAQYVSPEQAQGHDVGPTSDVYSLGVVGYEILAGHRPFSGESTVSVALKHISTPAPQIPGEVSTPVRELIDICLRKDPRTRYADGGELAAAAVKVRAGGMPPVPVSMSAQTRAVSAPPVAPATQTRLGRVTDPSNMGPAPRPTGQQNTGQAAQTAAPQRPVKKKSGNGWIWFIVIVAIAGIGVLVWALSSGLGDSGEESPTRTTTVIEQVPVDPPEQQGTPEETPEDTPEQTVPETTDNNLPTTENPGPTSTPGTGSNGSTPTTPTTPDNGDDGSNNGGTDNGENGGQTNGNGGANSAMPSEPEATGTGDRAADAADDAGLTL